MAEGWGQRVLDQIAAQREPKGNRGGAVYASVFPTLLRTHLFLSPQMTAWLDTAARATHLNRSTFVRRAVAVQIAHTLSLPMSQVLAASPAQGEYARVQTHRGGSDTGAGIEHFCPHPGCSGAHLRT